MKLAPLIEMLGGGSLIEGAKPKFKLRDAIVLASHERMRPSFDGKPAVLKDTVLRVSSISGKGSKRDPWQVNATDGHHFWAFEPDAIRLASDVDPDDGIYQTVNRAL